MICCLYCKELNYCVKGYCEKAQREKRLLELKKKYEIYSISIISKLKEKGE